MNAHRVQRPKDPDFYSSFPAHISDGGDKAVKNG